MALPCFSKFEKMEAAIEAYEECFDAVDDEQDLLMLGTLGGTLVCVKAVLDPTSRPECALAAGGYFVALKLWLKHIDKCNDLVMDAFKIGKDFEECSAEHKDVLNAAAAANS